MKADTGFKISLIMEKGHQLSSPVTQNLVKKKDWLKGNIKWIWQKKKRNVHSFTAEVSRETTGPHEE